MKTLIPMIMLLLLIVPNIEADTVVLKNGGEFEGNILKVTDTHIILDLFARKILLGGIIKLSKREIKSYVINNDYKHLKEEYITKPKTNTDKAKAILRLKNALLEEGKFKGGRL